MDHYPCHHGALWEREILPLVFPVCNEALMSSTTQRGSRGVACIGSLRPIHKAKGAWATKPRQAQHTQTSASRKEGGASPGALHLMIGTQMEGERGQGLSVWCQVKSFMELVQEPI